MCCLEYKGVDAGGVQTASDGDLEGAVDEAANAPGSLADAADAGPFCSTPLMPGAHPATLNDVPFDAWCAANPGRVIEWTCGRTVAVTIGVGVDCDEQYWFDSTSRKLLAVLQGCNGLNACAEGNADFAPPKDCLNGDVPVSDFVNVCVEGGLTTMAPDGAFATCRDDSQCPTGYRCGYFTNSSCGAVAECFYGDLLNNPTCSHEMRCACDGTPTEGCVGPWGGFTLKPVSTRVTGPCTAPPPHGN